MFSASSALGITPPHYAALDLAHDAARHEQHHQHDEQAVDEQVGLRELGAEELGRQRDERGAHQGPEQGAATADDGHQRNPHGEVQLEHGQWLQRREEDAVDAAAQGRERPREDERPRLDAHRVDARRLRGGLVLAHGAHLVAQAAAGNEGHHHEDEEHVTEREPELHVAAEEVEAERLLQAEDEDAHRAAGQLPLVYGHQAEYLRDGDGAQHEIGARQAERESAPYQGEDGGQPHGQERGPPRGQVPPVGGDRHRVGAQAHEGGVTEAGLTRPTAQQVPGGSPTGQQHERYAKGEERGEQEIPRRERGADQDDL